MAKQDKAEAEDSAEDQDTPAPAKGLRRFLSKKTLLIAGPALALLLAGGGAGAYFLLGHSKSAAKTANALPPTPPKMAFDDVPDILVNIQNSGGTPTYLKLSLSLEMDNDQAKAGVAAMMPRLVDQFQSYLRELRLDDLKGSEGVLRIKEELLRRADAAAAPYHVRDVLLKQMLVQ